MVARNSPRINALKQSMSFERSINVTSTEMNLELQRGPGLCMQTHLYNETRTWTAK